MTDLGYEPRLLRQHDQYDELDFAGTKVITK